MLPSLGPEASCPDTTRLGDTTKFGNLELRQVTNICYQSGRAQQYVTRRRHHGQVTKVPGKAQHISTEHSAGSRNRTPRARVSHHVQKPRPRVSAENNTSKFYKLSDVYKQLTKKMSGVCMAVAVALLPPPQTNPITLP